ncbi:UNVERIFIED_CONTAM: Pentatricopeptide repeat-containing protein [Sesamum calycinum]|uniref:Pentatricopeptide repeat-containing protein n=1 Tax=Sesamum calycinum TaxID=2727403 RepID=A0AAW2JFC7_9LAMI
MVAEAEKLISEMDERGMEIDEFTQSSLTRMYIEWDVGKVLVMVPKQEISAGCWLFDSMEEHGLIPDRCGYNSLIQMLATADLPQKATFYLRKMQEVGLVIDCVPYCAVISGYAKLGQMDMAVGLYKEMIGHGIKPKVIVYGVLINAFANTGSVNEATYYVDAMRNLGLQ